MLDVDKISVADETRYRCCVSAWLSVWLPVVVTLSICSNTVHLQVYILISAPKNWLLRATDTLPKKNQRAISWKLKNNCSKMVQQHCVGEVGKSVSFVLHIISIYSVPNIVEISQHTHYIRTQCLSNNTHTHHYYQQWSRTHYSTPHTLLGCSDCGYNPGWSRNHPTVS